MKQKIIIIIIILLTWINIYSQGFDWQYSARLPFETPTKFWGFDVAGTYIYNTGDFGFLSNNIPCCTFEDGAGIGFQAGIKYEQWLEGNYSIFSTLAFNYIPSKFLIESEPHPYRDYEDIITEYEYTSSTSYILFELGGKYRILETHFFVGAGINVSYLITEKHDFIERIISEKDFFFNEIKYPNASLAELNKLYFYPRLIAGYDLNLGKGKYSSIFISAAPPVHSVISEKNWNRWLFSFGISTFLF